MPFPPPPPPCCPQDGVKESGTLHLQWARGARGSGPGSSPSPPLGPALFLCSGLLQWEVLPARASVYSSEQRGWSGTLSPAVLHLCHFLPNTHGRGWGVGRRLEGPRGSLSDSLLTHPQVAARGAGTEALSAQLYGLKIDTGPRPAVHSSFTGGARASGQKREAAPCTDPGGDHRSSLPCARPCGGSRGSERGSPIPEVPGHPT